MKSPKLYRLTFLAGLLLGVGLLLVACGGVAPESIAEPEVEQPVTQQQEIAENPTATSAPTNTTEKPVEKEEVAEATSPPAKPTARQGFVATPPQEVQLASGGVQLVEFYATW